MFVRLLLFKVAVDTSEVKTDINPCNWKCRVHVRGVDLVSLGIDHVGLRRRVRARGVDLLIYLSNPILPQVVESVDTEDLKSSGIAPCGFESRLGDHVC